MTPLVLLGGWGCDARIWRPLASHWPAGLVVTTPDWPGYGTRDRASRPVLDDPTDIAALADTMAPDLPSKAVWVGWSLGGLLAATLLDHLPAPRAVVQLGMGPCFCHDDGISPIELASFRRAFARSPNATRQHFLRWQLRGEPAPRAAHRRLLALIGQAPCADEETLAAGLEQLANLDVTERLAAPPCPVWRLAGEQDPLLAPVLRETADHRLAEAGHCPMLSQPGALAEKLADMASAAEVHAGDARREAAPS